MNILKKIFTDYYEGIKYTLHPRDTEMENIDKMLLACHSGPPLARVDRVSFVVGRRSGFLPPIVPGVFKRI